MKLGAGLHQGLRCYRPQMIVISMGIEDSIQLFHLRRHNRWRSHQQLCGLADGRIVRDNR